jgi:uncharacterized protein YwgA
MDPKHAVLVAVQEEGREGLVGRTLLQKKLYFASVLVGEDMGFRPYYYGPYSQQVADATDSVVSNRFLVEQVDVFPDTNIFGERRRHSYELTEDGNEVLQSMADDREVAAWRDALRRINQHQFATDFRLLSVAAKVATILREAHRARVNEISRKAREYGWGLNKEEIRRVVDFLEYLGLVERQ